VFGIAGTPLMSKMECTLVSRSLSPHLQQLYTGFHQLHRRGAINLSQRVELLDSSMAKQPWRRNRAWNAHLDAIVNGQVRCHYDTLDGPEIDEDYLSDADYYFKRSYHLPTVSSLGEAGRRVVPLGLNYLVYPDHADRFAIVRSIALGHGRQRLRELLRAANLPHPAALGFTPRLHSMEFTPDLWIEPRVLFIAAAWDPYSSSGASSEDIEDKIRVNETRATSIRRLRREFGSLFCGGLVHNKFAVENYADLLIPTASLTSKRSYLNLVKRHAVCVATTGLYGSIGWKFAEYVGFARAIVSERLQYEVPDLERGKHYLQFDNPEQLVESVGMLISQHQMRREMMEQNAAYYATHVRPSSLIMNTLSRALSESP